MWNIYNEIHFITYKCISLFSRSEDQEKKIEKLEMQVEAQGLLLREIGNFLLRNDSRAKLIFSNFSIIPEFLIL